MLDSRPELLAEWLARLLSLHAEAEMPYAEAEASPCLSQN